MEKEIFERVKEAFEANEAVQHLFVTSDGQCFFTNNSAANHSKDLQKAGGDAGVVKVFREQIDSLLKGLEALKNSADKVLTTDEEKELATAAEKSLDKMNKVELQQKAASLGIEFKEEDTKANLIDLITNFNTK
jgi:hypothetical protein